MAEVVSPVANSRIMANVAREDARPEVILRTGRQDMAFHYRLCRRRLPCWLALFFPRRHAMIRPHGRFRHDPNPNLLSWPTYWSEFWKLKTNSKGGGDSVRLNRSLAAGRSVLDIWERPFRDRLKGLVDAALGGAGQERRSGDRECELMDEI